MKFNSAKLTVTVNDNEKLFYHSMEEILTKNGRVLERYKNTVKSLENNQRINGYFKISPKFDLYPSEFKKAMNVLLYLGVSSELIDEEPKKKTKGKYVIVKLSEEQKAELKKLKSLC